MKITIITVGKIKETYFKDAIDTYLKKIQKKMPIVIFEVPDERAPENMSQGEELQVKDKEGRGILKHIKDKTYVIALEIGGKQLTSDSFLTLLTVLEEKEFEDTTFVIGGSLGLSQEVLKRSDYKLSFSQMTFPHQLMRVILLEQLSKTVN